MPTFLSLFAGIGGFDLGLERAGFLPARQIELDPFCQRVLAARWPGIERAGDIRLLHASNPEGLGQRRDDPSTPGIGGAGWRGPTDSRLDLLVGGFPCQDLSVAGKRAGLGGERSGLFWEIVRIAKIEKPTWGLFENVPGLISSHRGADLWLVLQGLRECWPAVGYRVLDSRYFGVAQRRRRVFFVCGPTEAGVAQVLALTEGGAGDPEAGGEAGADVAPTIVGGVAGSRSHDKPSGSDRRPVVVSHALSAGVGGRFGSGRDGQDDFVIADPLTAGSNPNSNMAGRRREDDVNLVAGPLGGGNDGIGRRTEDDPNLVAFDTTQITSKLNRNNPKPGDPCHPLAAGAHPPAITGSAVRRLTPLECERLQGFPDFWTCLCGRSEAIYEALRMVYLGVLAHGLSEREARDTVEVLQEAVLRMDLREAGKGEDGRVFKGPGTGSVHSGSIRPWPARTVALLGGLGSAVSPATTSTAM